MNLFKGPEKIQKGIHSKENGVCDDNDNVNTCEIADVKNVHLLKGLRSQRDLTPLSCGSSTHSSQYGEHKFHS